MEEHKITGWVMLNRDKVFGVVREIPRYQVIASESDDAVRREKLSFIPCVITFELPVEKKTEGAFEVIEADRPD